MPWWRLPHNPAVPRLFTFSMPRLTLSRKVFLALATLLVLLLLVFAGFSILALQRGIGPYVAEVEIRRMDWLADILEKRYATDGNWEAFRNDRFVLFRLRSETLASDFGRRQPQRSESREPSSAADNQGMPPPFERPPGFPPPEGGGPPFGRPDMLYQRLGLVDGTGAYVAGARVAMDASARLPLQMTDGRLVGYLVLAPMEEIRSEADRAFFKRQAVAIVLTGLVGLALALALSYLLARRWFAPIDQLMQGARDITRGRLDTQVPIQGSDELALLGQTFNSMTARLASIEASRRAWLADVAHELRTPLAAMRAEIEALQDGIRTFDDRTALRLHRQVMRLGQLVDDLRSSMREPDSAPRSTAPTFPIALLTEALAMTRDRFAQRRIAVEAEGLDIAGPQPVVAGDAQRLHQVFMNLLENTLAYTDAGGRLQLSVAIDDAGGVPLLHLRFDDTAPGPSADDLPRLFERLFRGDTSRTRGVAGAEGMPGGFGLGRSICRTLIEEHDGTIEATNSPLGGLRMTISLPLSNEP
ncbi:ATP-binding protein [soil metagenome]